MWMMLLQLHVNLNAVDDDDDRMSVVCLTLLTIYFKQFLLLNPLMGGI